MQILSLLNGLIFFAEEDQFDDLKNIGTKIIPGDIWSFVIQLTATFILVLILAKFLVKPAKKFINNRKQYIESNIQSAEYKNQEADEKLSDANKQLKEARTTSKEIIEEAKITALNEKDRIVLETKQEVKALKAKADADIANERRKMQEELSQEVVDVALLAASKVVDREINDEDNRKIVENFIEGND